MNPAPLPSWYTVHLDTDKCLRMLSDDGEPLGDLPTPALAALSVLAAAIHRAAPLLGERELRQVEQFIALQRWRR